MKWFAAVLIFALAGCAVTAEQDASLLTGKYRALLADPVCTDRDRRMDESRHPVELLQFAHVRPGMQVLDVATGAGITAGKTLHRIEESFVAAEVKRAGFVLDAEGAFMRNAADTREGSSNQATPPSDRFVLRFVKR